MITLSDRLVATKGRPHGFDFMRISLAVLIIGYHSIVTSYGEAAQDAYTASYWAVWVKFLVPMFFALSGFLVAGSLGRTRTIVSFLGLRAMRILPALGVEITLSALILGPVFTVLPLAAYVSDPKFRVYFLNIVGNIHYYLPGVFVGNPSDRVNGQLWTIPGELLCYATLTVLFVVGLARRPRLFALATVFLLLAVPLNQILRHGGFPSQTDRSLVLYFLAGVALFLNKERVPWNGWAAAACAVVSAVLFYTPNGLPFTAAPIAYLTVYLGLLHPKKPAILDSGDYSYGLYLYGYPIQQAVSATFPGLRHWWFNFPVAFTLALGFAWVSWHLIEKRVLAQRPHLMKFEDFTIGLWNAIPKPFRPARQAPAAE